MGRAGKASAGRSTLCTSKYVHIDADDHCRLGDDDHDPTSSSSYQRGRAADKLDVLGTQTGISYAVTVAVQR
jgi:hypothetical protein